jgi:hypothetical protein
MTPTYHRRTQLKTQLLQQINALEPGDAILPSEHPVIDQIICELETLTPIDQPLREEHWPLLLGSWALVYASRGTVVTRRSRQLPLPVSIQRVWQRLTGIEEQGATGAIATETVRCCLYRSLANSRLLPRASGNPTTKGRVPGLVLGPLAYRLPACWASLDCICLKLRCRCWNFCGRKRCGLRRTWTRICGLGAGPRAIYLCFGGRAGW